MKIIKNKTNSIKIIGEGFTILDNNLRLQISCDIIDIGNMIYLFPKSNGNQRIVYNKVIYSETIHIGDLYDLLETNKVELSDVGLSGLDIIYNFSTMIIYLKNVLDLDLNEWEII